MDEIKIENIGQYIKAINDLKEIYPNQFIASTSTITHFLFRGASKKSYELLPGIQRKENNSYTNIKESAYTFTHERRLINDFKCDAISYLKNQTLNNLYEWAELAQHYGVPTRYLDWTSNPLVALYFACRNNKNEDAAVWILHFRNYHNFTISNKANELKLKYEIINDLLLGKEIVEYPIIYKPYYFDIRMSAQSSHFMVWGSNKQALDRLHQKKIIWFIKVKLNQLHMVMNRKNNIYLSLI